MADATSRVIAIKSGFAWLAPGQSQASTANDYQLERDAAEARVRSERRCGQLLKEMEMARGGNPAGANQHGCGNEVVVNPDNHKQKTLSEMGVTKNQSIQRQKLTVQHFNYPGWHFFPAKLL